MYHAEDKKNPKQTNPRNFVIFLKKKNLTHIRMDQTERHSVSQVAITS